MSMNREALRHIGLTNVAALFPKHDRELWIPVGVYSDEAFDRLYEQYSAAAGHRIAFYVIAGPDDQTMSAFTTEEDYSAAGAFASALIAEHHGTTIENLEEWVLARTLRAKREVLADIADGTVPEQVQTFSELHDYVDANGYGGFFDEGVLDAATAYEWLHNLPDMVANRVQENVHEWLANGREPQPEPVPDLRRLTILATVDAKDLDEFVGDLEASMDARLNEVYGDDGTLLTTLRVKDVQVEG